MNILIIGDSFAADWSVKYKFYKGWPNLLAEKYDVTNSAQAGVSEYKIYLQLKQKENVLETFDLVIVHHTSPYRVPTVAHPMHEFDVLHGNADLIYSDIDYHSKKIKNYFNKSLKAAKAYYDYHYDEEFYETTSKLYREKIESMLENNKTLFLDCKPFQSENPGLINHMNEKGNQLVYKKICDDIINRIK